MTKVAFVCLGAYNISSWNNYQNFDRQSVYSIALHEALRLADNKGLKERDLLLDLFIVDNTIINEGEIIPEFRSQLKHERIKDVLFINNNDLGSKNKGAGEYLMCCAVIEKHKETLSSYDWVIYYTLRQIIVSPLVLTTILDVENSTPPKETNIIAGNPEYLYLNSKKALSAPGHFCDMIFAMRPTQFFKYIESMSPEELVKKKMSSERNLFEFVESLKSTGEGKLVELPRLGVMRHNYAINKTEVV
jgi:hypothetical protein